MDKKTADSYINFIDLAEPPKLILGYRSTDRKVSLSKVALARDAQEMFTKIAEEVLADRSEREPEDWEPSRPVSNETYLIATCEEIGNVPQVANSNVQPLLSALIDTADIFEMTGKSLRKVAPYFYAFQFGTGEGSVTFLRKLNPLRGLHQKKLGLLDDQLSLARHAVFAFDDYVDLIITQEHLFIFNQSAFATIFRGQSDLVKLMKGWAEGIRASTPMTEDSYQLLLSKGANDSRMARRIESIARRGHLRSLDAGQLRAGMIRCDLDDEVYMNKLDELTLTKGSLSEILKFLNEDMFRGVLTDDPFEVDSKAPR